MTSIHTEHCTYTCINSYNCKYNVIDSVNYRKEREKRTTVQEGLTDL